MHVPEDIRSPHIHKNPPLKTVQIDEEYLTISCSPEQSVEPDNGATEPAANPEPGPDKIQEPKDALK
jgi:hypothetical protein